MIIRRRVSLRFNRPCRRMVDLKSLLQRLPVPIHATDNTGRLVFWSKGCEKLTGYSSKQLNSLSSSQALSLLFPDESIKQQVVAQWTSHTSNNRPFQDWQWDVTCTDGTVRTISWTSLNDCLWPWDCHGHTSSSSSTRKSSQLYWAIGSDVTAQKRAHTLLQLVVSGFAATSAEQFFERLVLHLAATTGMEHALVGELGPDHPSTVRTIAFCCNNQIAPNVEYALKGTPCENAINCYGIAVYPCDLCKIFPEDEDAIKMGVQSYLGIPLHSTRGFYRSFQLHSFSYLYLSSFSCPSF